MTREELINSKEYKIISAAVDWYQDHQDADALDGFEAGYEAAINKACEWLKTHIHTEPSRFKNNAINEFRKAMEV